MASRVMLCYGTRPQIIKASVLRRALGGSGSVTAVDTGQHYDYTLNELLYTQLGVEPPDLTLEVGSASHADQTAAILQRTEAVCLGHRPALMAVIGDTNSTLGCALAAAKLRIPVAHVEAGLRAKDQLMAEEINRRVVDAFAQLLFTPSAVSTRHVQAERHDAVVVETGDVAYDVLLSQVDRLPDPASLLPVPAPAGYVYATLHRAELVDARERFLRALDALDALPVPVVLPLHPRTRKALDTYAPGREWRGSLHLRPAVGYHESLALTRGAEVVVTDSGGVQREAFWLGTPCVTLRSETEWEETLTVGANALLDPAGDLARLPEVVAAQRARGGAGWDRTVYGRGNAGELMAAAIGRWFERAAS